MTEYINKQALLAEYDCVHVGPPGGARKLIEEAPPADVVPVVHGRWIVTEEYNDVIEMDVVKYACSACGEYRLSATTLSQATNYCPNCGARMDGE